MVLALRYRRVSGLGQEDNSSLEKQLERMDEYCAVNGYVSATGISLYRSHDRC